MSSISDRTAELEAELEKRDGQIAQWIAERESKDAEIKMLTELVAILKEQVEALRRDQNRNSRNSSKPPSSDALGSRRTTRRKKKPTGRKRGGQKGHKGHYRELLPEDEVDMFVEVFCSRCEVCQKQPPKVLSKRPVRHQVVDILENGCRILVEYRRHRYACPCGERLLARDEEVPRSWFGPRLKSVTNTMVSTFHLSRIEVVHFLRDVFGISISVGSVSNFEKQMSDALEAAFEEAAQSVEGSAVKHVDETSWVRDFERVSLWVLASALVSVFRVVKDGSRKSLREIFGRTEGILVSDRATVFLYWPMNQRQICWSHLLRLFVDFSQRDGPGGELGQELLDYATLVFTYWKDSRTGKISQKEFEVLIAAVKVGMKPCIERAVKANIRGVSGSCENLLTHWEAMWTFVSTEGVEPTNNHAERELRRAVLWRKRCFGSQSERGERFVERLLTVTHTLRKQGRGVLDFLQQSFLAWLDDAPAPKLLAAAV